MVVERFIGENDQKVWTKELENGGTFYSACLKTTSDNFNPETGIVNEVKHMNWLKGNDEALLERTMVAVAAQLKAGKLVPYRVYSETPFYDNQELDRKGTNDGSLGEVIAGRYSDTRLGTPDKALQMDRQFITLEAQAIAPPVVEAAPLATEA